jgi:hypothetical protein
MNGTGKVIGAVDGSDARLQRILNRVFRCSHRRQSRPITPKGEAQAYAVCLDCGTRLAYDLNAMRVGTPVLGSSLDRQNSEVRKEKVLEIPAHGFILSAPRRWETIQNYSRRLHRELGARRSLLLGLLAISLAGGLLYLLNRPAGPEILTAREPARPLPSAGPEKSSPSLPVEERGTESVLAPHTTQPVAPPTVSMELSSTTEAETIGPDSTSAPEVPRSNPVLRLEGKGSVIVLGRGEVPALELSQHPDRLSKLIRSGSVFTVPRGTAIKLLQGDRLVIKVLILEGSMVGQEGWAQPWQARTLPSASSVKSSPSLPVEGRGTELVLAPRTTQPVAPPTASVEPKSTTEKKTIGPDSTSASEAPRSDPVLRLKGKGSVIVLGRGEMAALELSRHPTRLRKLIRSGSVFTVPRGTAIKLLRGNRLAVKVLILEGSMVGQEGWVQARQVSP